MSVNTRVAPKRQFPKAALWVAVIGAVALGGSLVFAWIPVGTPVTTIDQAHEIASDYLARYYPGLVVAEIMEFTNQYYVRAAETSTSINALELLVDRGASRIYFEPGPNMMWNTKYGHMGLLSNPTAEMPITSGNATTLGQQWLDKNFLGAVINEAEVFYGHYTLDFNRSGIVAGMLSVNGYTGEIWYHSWHGQFVAMREY